MSFRLIATDGKVTVAIEDDTIKAAVAKMFQDLAASAASSAAEAPMKRGPGRPPKSNTAQLTTNAAEEPPPVAQ
jgi:hypothetical protein